MTSFPGSIVNAKRAATNLFIGTEDEITMLLQLPDCADMIFFLHQVSPRSHHQVFRHLVKHASTSNELNVNARVFLVVTADLNPHYHDIIGKAVGKLTLL